MRIFFVLHPYEELDRWGDAQAVCKLCGEAIDVSFDTEIEQAFNAPELTEHLQLEHAELYQRYVAAR